MIKIVLFSSYLIAFSVSANDRTTSFIFEEDEAFSEYLERAHTYLDENKKWVNTKNKSRELAAVMPFELLPEAALCEGVKNKGILLSHGLSDSPFSMRDPAYAMQKACYHVRVVLLPGHGTKAENLLTVSRDDWRTTFRNAADSFYKEVDVLYVGGFSTGGALAVEYAWQHTDKVAGAVLFSPVFKVNSSIDWLSPWLAFVKDWLDHYPTDDFAKYASIPVPAIAEVYKLSKEVRGLILDDPKSLPVFVALSEDDQTVDSSVTETVFKEGLIGSTSQMVMYSQNQKDNQIDRIKTYNTNWLESNILGLSHMAIHGNPNNPYYGELGEYRICSWYLSDEALYDACRTDQTNWFGEQSDTLLEKSPHAGRVSWNPGFDELMKDVTSFMQKNANRH
jgi:esterase/lipase